MSPDTPQSQPGVDWERARLQNDALQAIYQISSMTTVQAEAIYAALVPLVAKAQREADVAALEVNAASRRYGGQIPQWAANYLCSLPLISEEATRGE